MVLNLMIHNQFFDPRLLSQEERQELEDSLQDYLQKKPVNEGTIGKPLTADVCKVLLNA
jgi:hypothetical protein